MAAPPPAGRSLATAAFCSLKSVAALCRCCRQRPGGFNHCVCVRISVSHHHDYLPSVAWNCYYLGMALCPPPRPTLSGLTLFRHTHLPFYTPPAFIRRSPPCPSCYCAASSCISAACSCPTPASYVRLHRAPAGVPCCRQQQRSVGRNVALLMGVPACGKPPCGLPWFSCLTPPVAGRPPAAEAPFRHL